MGVKINQIWNLTDEVGQTRTYRVAPKWREYWILIEVNSIQFPQALLLIEEKIMMGTMIYEAKDDEKGYMGLESRVAPIWGMDVTFM